MNASHVLPLLLASLAWQTALAAPIYKSVDRAGRVTYSSTPPAGTKAEAVELPPPPTELETRQATEQIKKTEEKARELETQRLEREAEQKAREEAEAEEARRREAEKPAPEAVAPPMNYPPPYYGGRPARPVQLPSLPRPK